MAEDFGISVNDVIVGPFTPVNGQTEINVDFPFESADFVKVYRRASAGTTESLLSASTDYTITGEGQATGGRITLNTAANGTDIYAVVLDIPIERETDIIKRQALTSRLLNRELDRLTQVCQQLKRDIGKAFAVGATVAGISALTPVGDALLSFNATATAFDQSLSRTEVVEAIALINSLGGAVISEETLTVPTKAAISALTLGSAQFVRTAFHTSIAYGGGALYRLYQDGTFNDGSVEPVGVDSRFKHETGDGKWVTLVLYGGDLLTSQGGSRGVGSSYDDTADVQACIDYVLGRNPKSTFNGSGVVTVKRAESARVLLDQRHYYFTDTIRLTWGDGNAKLTEFAGRGPAFRGATDITMAGTICQWSSAVLTKAGLSWAADRGTRVRGMWLEGPLTATYQALDFNNGGFLSRSAWANGSQNGTNPCAAMLVDGRAGAAVGYGSETMPAWTGSALTTDLNASTRPAAFDVSCRGWETAFMCGFVNENADFPVWRDGFVEYCRDAYAIGASQTRVPDIQGVHCANIHTFMDAASYGLGTGRGGGVVLNCSVGGACARIINISGSATHGPTIFAGFYAERLWRIFDESGGTTSDGHVMFVGGILSLNHASVFNAPSGNWGVPVDVGKSAGQTVWQFDGTRISHRSVISFDANVRLNISASATERSASVADVFEAYLQNATMGGVVVRRTATDIYDHRVQHDRYNVSTASREFAATVGTDDLRTGRNYCVPDDVRRVRRGSSLHYDLCENTPRTQVRNKATPAHITSVTLSNRVLTITFNSLSDADAMRIGIEPGDVIVDVNTNAAFAIYSRTGSVVLARQETGFRAAAGAGTYTDLSGISLTTGDFRFLNSRRYLISTRLAGERVPGSTSIRNIRGPLSDVSSGNTAAIEEVTVGDYWSGENEVVGDYASGDFRVTARSASAGTMTLANSPRAGFPAAVQSADATALDTALDVLEDVDAALVTALRTAMDPLVASSAMTSGEADTLRDAVEAIANRSSAQMDALATAIKAMHRPPHYLVKLDWFIRQPPASISVPTNI